MECKFYQIDAFTNEIFGGNPAGVVILDQWITDDMMQNIAAENNLPETAFIVQKDSFYEIRWFTPEVEIALCGHATLASAHVLYEHLGYDKPEIIFRSPIDELSVRKEDGMLALNFPVSEYKQLNDTNKISEALGVVPVEAYAGKYCFAVLENEVDILNANPDLEKVKKIIDTGIIITAKGNQADFVSRFFAPSMGIDEDPVTGSAHTYIIPYWANKLGKNEMRALQLSKRRGELFCRFLGKRVEMSGYAKTYLEGKIFLNS